MELLVLRILVAVAAVLNALEGLVTVAQEALAALA
jgi:hypothetical protein